MCVYLLHTYICVKCHQCGWFCATVCIVAFKYKSLTTNEIKKTKKTINGHEEIYENLVLFFGYSQEKTVVRILGQEHLCCTA